MCYSSPQDHGRILHTIQPAPFRSFPATLLKNSLSINGFSWSSIPSVHSVRQLRIASHLWCHSLPQSLPTSPLLHSLTDPSTTRSPFAPSSIWMAGCLNLESTTVTVTPLAVVCVWVERTSQNFPSGLKWPSLFLSARPLRQAARRGHLTLVLQTLLSSPASFLDHDCPFLRSWPQYHSGRTLF